MKKNLTSILAVIVCILTAVCLVRMIRLENQLETMENNMNSEMRMLRDSVNAISGSVRDVIEEEASLISDTAYSYRDPQYEDRSVTVEYSITPKQYHPKQTILTLYTNHGSHPMVYQNGRYTAAFEIPLFDYTTIDSVQFEQDGVIRTQKLDDYLYPKEEYIPTVTANFGGSSSVSRKNGGDTAIKTFSGNVTVDIKQTPTETGIRSVVIEERLDGTLYSTTELSLNKEEAWEASGNTRPTEDIDALYPAHYSHVLENYKVEIPYGSSYAMVVIVTDEHGLIHRVTVDSETIDANGDVSKRREDWYNNYASIYTADGECLYQVEYDKVG